MSFVTPALSHAETQIAVSSAYMFVLQCCKHLESIPIDSLSETLRMSVAEYQMMFSLKYIFYNLLLLFSVAEHITF